MARASLMAVVAVVVVVMAAMNSRGASAQFAASPSPGEGYVPQQCNSALLAFTSCRPSLASMVARGIDSPGLQNIPGFATSSMCCTSLKSIDPTCFRTLLAQARQFFDGPSIPGTPDITENLIVAAYQLPTLCKLRAEFVPLE
ncbi:hypothetical protein L7F22_047247 [Adiantum nelumboides]|nr:hypothetical protein [Adiantum nelumboides]